MYCQYALTCFAVVTGIVVRARAVVHVHQIDARASILTWVACTLQNV